MSGRWVDREGPWKNKARSVQLQLRNRFRVCVDRHWSRSSDGYFSSTLERWLHRFRDFRKESLPPSSVFYRKRVPKDIYVDEDSVIVRKLQALAVPIIGSVSHVFMHGFNRVQVYGAEKLRQTLLFRSDNTPLLTVSNHVASLDDPLVIASLIPRSVIFDIHNVRWTLCATDRCFSNPVVSAFFRCVKVLPVSRGDGIYQKGMDMAISKLNSGGWVHIFPEGTRSRDGGKSVGSAKRGVGRLILDADKTPLVLPFVHSGMQEIMPIGAKVPRIGKTVTILVGDPINFDDLLNLERSEQVPRGMLYDAVSSRVGHRLQELRARLEELAINWESFGMGNSMDREPSEHENSEMPTLNPSTFGERVIKFGCFGGIMSRMNGCMEQNELLGFAARALFLNRHGWKEDFHSLGQGSVRVGPLKAWKQFLEANILQQWSY